MTALKTVRLLVIEVDQVFGLFLDVLHRVPNMRDSQARWKGCATFKAVCSYRHRLRCLIGDTFPRSFFAFSFFPTSFASSGIADSAILKNTGSASIPMLS